MLSEQTRQRIVAETTRYPQHRSALLPALQIAQDEAGWLSPETLSEVAELLDTDANALYDLATLYSLLHTKPAGKYVLRVCNGLSCYLRGSDPLIEHLSRRLGVQPYGTSDDGMWTLEPFECLAACDGAPAMMVNAETYLNMNVEQVDALIEDLRGRTEVTAGSSPGSRDE